MFATTVALATQRSATRLQRSCGGRLKTALRTIYCRGGVCPPLNSCSTERSDEESQEQRNILSPCHRGTRCCCNTGGGFSLRCSFVGAGSACPCNRVACHVERSRIFQLSELKPNLFELLLACTSIRNVLCSGIVLQYPLVEHCLSFKPIRFCSGAPGLVRL